MIFLSAGCASMYPVPTYFSNDHELQNAAFELVNDFLHDQQTGQQWDYARQEYGAGVPEYYNLQNYRCESYGSWAGNPAIGCRVFLSRNSFPVWENEIFDLSYSQELRANNDQYLGLRIKGNRDGTLN